MRFVNGTEQTLQVHSIHPLQVLQVMDESGIQTWEELKHFQPEMKYLRFAQRVAALALTFKNKDPWTVERIQTSFASMDDVGKVFLACAGLSTEAFGPKTAHGTSMKSARKTPYG